MKWIIDDIKRGWAQLQRGQTLLTIFLIALFGGLSYLVAGYALRTDSVLSYLRVTSGGCRTMDNALIIALFSGMIFFSLTAVLTIGEVQRLFQARQRGAWRDAGLALRWSIFWGSCAIGISVIALLFFRANCY
jgi:hypothetical protein